MEEIHYLIPEKLLIIQDSDFFKFGTDSILLADFSNIRDGDIVLDLGSGSGVIPLLLAFKQKPAKIIGIEIQEELVEISRRSVELNNLTGIIDIIKGDIRDLGNHISPGSIDVLVSNPPYLPLNGGRITENEKKAVARHEIYVSLEDVIREGSKALRYGGKISMVYRSRRMVELIEMMKKYYLEPKRLCMVHPREGRASNVFLITAQKGARVGIDIMPPLIIYKGNTDEYTDKVKKIYGEDIHD
jgi:tRNA1Val (adenine37-N6)-methyltransferase